MEVQIFSDVVCPFCYIGKRRFETAVREFEHGDQITVRWRSFELDPNAPRNTEPVDMAAKLARKYGMSREQAEAAQARMVRMADGEGLAFQLDHPRPGNTFDAHRVLHHAETVGLQDALKERYLAAYQVEGKAIADHAVLRAEAVAVGLDGDEVDRILASDAYGAEVRADEEQAQDYGISGVPFFIIDNTFAVSGAQDVDVFLNALERAWAKHRPAFELVTDAAGGDAGADAAAACGPDGCEVPQR